MPARSRYRHPATAPVYAQGGAITQRPTARQDTACPASTWMACCRRARNDAGTHAHAQTHTDAAYVTKIRAGTPSSVEPCPSLSNMPTACMCVVRVLWFKSPQRGGWAKPLGCRSQNLNYHCVHLSFSNFHIIPFVVIGDIYIFHASFLAILLRITMLQKSC